MNTLAALRHALLSCLLLALTTGQAIAQQSDYDLSSLDPGQLLLNLNASEEQEVEQDTLIATLQYTTQGRDKTALQNEVNMAIDEALTLLEESAPEEVEYSTEQYHVYIYRPGRPNRSDIEEPVWRAQQGLRLTSTNSGELLELAGQLQEAGLNMAGLRYTLSREQYEATADTLTTRALESLQARAQEAAGTLGKSAASLIEVSIDGNRNVGYYPEARTAAASDSGIEQPPSASPGKTRVSVTVSAKALLNP